MLDVDHDAFGALRLGDASRAVLKGTRTVTLRKPAKGRAAKVKAARSTAVGATAADLDAVESVLWDRLREWRSETAKAHGVPAYVVFHDATLLELARACPGTLARLSDVPGIGAAKLERYGQSILKICQTHAAEHGLVAR